jgi:hypothetical protein
MQVGILYAMYRRGLYRDYPYFFNYTILQIVSFVILFAIKNVYSLYFYGYWVSVALDAIVSFFVLQEIFRDAFRPYEALRDLSVILFRWSALIVLLVGGMAAITGKTPSQIDFVLNAIMLGDRSIRLMQCGLVFFLLLFSEYLGISRRNAVFGIAFGFGLFASVKMLAVLAAAHPAVFMATVVRWVNSGVYDVSVLIWLGYALFSAPSRSSAAVPSPVRTKDWDNALQDARGPVAAISMLDTMEAKVEQLLYPRDEVRGVAATKAS